MQYGALTRAQRRIYQDAVSRSHHREVELVAIRRRDGKRLFSLTNRFLGGGVEGDADLTPATTLECEVLDDEYALDWAHGRHRKFAVEVVDSRFIVGLDDWVEETIFTGPLWDFDRQGALVRLEADGPERDAMGSVREADSDPARTRAVAVLRKYLKEAGFSNGELRLPPSKRTLPRDVTEGVRRGKKQKNGKRPKRRLLRADRADTYWGVCEPIAEAIDRDLFADGHGNIRLRRPVSRPQFSLTERHLLAPVKEDRGDDSEETTNTWVAVGANPKGPRKRVRGRAQLPRRHPASAWSLRKNGKPRQIIEVIDNPKLRTNKVANRACERRRDRAMREQKRYEAEVLPVIPWVRPDTLGRLPVKAGRVVARVSRWRLPLGPGPDPLLLGATRRERL